MHKHVRKGDAYYDRAPWCDLPTKKACDARFRAHNLQRKMDYEAGVEERRLAEAARREAAYITYNEGEARRVAAYLEEYSHASS